MPEQSGVEGHLNKMVRAMRELRLSNRYQLAALLYASWRNTGGTISNLAGVTRDISMRGVSFLTSTNIEVGTCIELDVYLPFPSRQGRGIKLHGEGTIVRVEPLGVVEKRVAAEVLFQTEPEATLLTASSIQ